MDERGPERGSAPGRPAGSRVAPSRSVGAPPISAHLTPRCATTHNYDRDRAWGYCVQDPAPQGRPGGCPGVWSRGGGDLLGASELSCGGGSCPVCGSSHCRPGGWRSGEWATPAHPQGRVLPSLGATELLWLLLGPRCPLLVRLSPTGLEGSPHRAADGEMCSRGQGSPGACAACGRSGFQGVGCGVRGPPAWGLRAGQGWGGQRPAGP